MDDNKNEYEIVLWIEWQTAYDKVKKGEYKSFRKDLSKKERKKMRAFLVNYFLENRNELYKRNQTDGKIDFPFNGSYHQNADDGIPVIKYNGNLYAYKVSMRLWGDLMAEVFSVINGKKYMSIDEFWDMEEEERKEDEENTYMYLDFWLDWDKLKQKEGTV
jgi:hypothetical protein